MDFPLALCRSLALDPALANRCLLAALSLPHILYAAIWLKALNVGIYKAIGKVGVYYGTRLGHTVPWVTGFPFSVVPHPQYVGSALSVWGGAALLANQLPPDCCGGLANSQ
ncbi:phosphatidyl-N-methylethanolamine N-methyltransferase, partial [Haematococcus lacustris]